MSKLPTIAFYCVDCGSFNVQIRKRQPSETDPSEWHHPNKGGTGRESFDPDEHDLEGQCLDCKSTDWDAIEKGNDWWKEFREWHAEQSNQTGA